MEFSKYTAKSIKEVLDILETGENGLSEKEAENRLKVFGPNEVKTRKTGLLDIFWRQFKSPFFYLLFAAALITFFVGEKSNGFLILFFVVTNVALGFFQESKAEKAIFLLKKYIPAKIKVLREGKEKIIDKALLVPGDMVLLEAGNIAPADLRTVEMENFLVDESVLSGESVAVPKILQPLTKETNEIFEAKNIIFAGSSIVSGKAKAIVVAAGKNTAMGEITKLVSGIKRQSVYENDLLKFSKFILKFVVVTIFFVFLINLLIKGSEKLFEFLIFSIALIVSIIPEALPAVITFAFSQGALKLAEKKIVVKRLSAIEDLGNIEVLCTDKTGTLTENKLKLENIYSKDEKKCWLFGALSSSSFNPFDVAIFKNISSDISLRAEGFRKISEIPFDSFRLRNSVLAKEAGGGEFLIVRGAPEIILGLCSDFGSNSSKEKTGQEMRETEQGGKRTLAVAFKEFDEENYSVKDEDDLKFLGYFSFIDPLKKTAAQTVKLAEKLGLQIKIITGDSAEVAGNVAKAVGLIKNQGQVVLGSLIDSLFGEELEKICQEFSVFARVSPQTKYKIVEALQKKYAVGFLGEGINDAPALKMANVALAVPEAVDISKEIADIVLLEADLKVIVDGIKEGRNIFSNINKYVKCALASNFGNFYSIAIISFFIPFLPMLPAQILLGNLLSDFPLISITTDNLDAEELRKPKSYQFNKVLVLIISLALVSTVFDFIFFGIFYKSQPAVIQTLWFVESILTEILLIFIIRTRHFFLKAKRPGWPLILLTVLDAALIIWLPFSAFGQKAFHFISPPIFGLLTVFSLLIGYFVVSETVKLIYFRKK